MAWLLALPVVALPAPQRVVVISIDGLRPEFYLSQEWDTPNLHRLAREGARAERMLSVFPSITYVNHTTLVTGVRPEGHGIFGNTLFDQETGPQIGWCFQAERIQAPALWDLGVTSLALSWPVSVGAPVTWNIPEIFHVDGLDQQSTESLIRGHSTPGLFGELDAHLPRPFPQTFAEWDDWLPATFAWIWKHHHPQLGLVHVLNADWTQHRVGPDDPQAHAAVAHLDRVVGALVTNLDPADTTLLIVGDHGFAPVHHAIALNRLFLEQGWIELDGTAVRSFEVMAQTNGGSAAIYCKRPELEDQVLRLLRLHAPGHYRMVDRAELDRFSTFPGALCALSALPGFSLRGDCRKDFLEKTARIQGQHGHLPAQVPTGLIAWGKGVEGGRKLGELNMLQVAPTVARLLDLQLPNAEARPIRLNAPASSTEK